MLSQAFRIQGSLLLTETGIVQGAVSWLWLFVRRKPFSQLGNIDFQEGVVVVVLILAQYESGWLRAV